MKKACLNITLALLFGVVSLIAVGCHGPGETAAERKQDLKRQNRLQHQMIVDDIDAVFLNDRPSRLSEYTVR